MFSSSVWIILLLGLAGFGGFYGGSWYRKKMRESELASAEELSGKILENAKKEAETIKKEAKILAKDEILKAQAEFDRESKERRGELQKMEKRLLHKEENLEKKMDLLDKKEIEISRREKGASKREKNLEEQASQLRKLQEEAQLRLERVAGISKEEAKSLQNSSKTKKIAPPIYVHTVDNILMKLGVQYIILPIMQMLRQQSQQTKSIPVGGQDLV